MKREFLKGLGIEDSSIIDRILDENGADLNRERAKYGDYDAVRQRAENAENALKAFEGVDVDALKKQVKTLETDKMKEIEKLKLDYEISGALAAAGARNDKAVRALLDMSKIKLEDGKLSGLEDQLKQLRADNDFLFSGDGKSPLPMFSGKSSGGEKEGSDSSGFYNIINESHR